jgi:fibronectin type 3 domain-containing protein
MSFNYHPAHHRDRGFQPRLEALEHRDCPSVTAPTGLQVNAISPTQVLMSWNDQAGETGYIVLRWDGTQTTQLASLPADTTTYAATDQPPGAVEWLSVEAIDAVGGAAQSQWVQLTLPKEPITAPTTVQATALSTTQIAVTWAGAAGATGYQVYEWDGSQTTQLADVAANVNSYTVSNLSPGQTYYFYIKAYNSSNNAITNWTQSQTMSPPVIQSVPLNAPGFLTLKAASSTEIDLTWQAAAGATGYNVYSWNGKQSVLVASLGTQTRYAVKSLSPATIYWFSVQATDGVSTATTSWHKIATPLGSKLQAPTVTVQMRTMSSVLVSWTASPHAVGYRIYESTGGNFTLWKTVSSRITKAVVSGINSQSTWFLVQAFTQNNLYYANSKPVLVSMWLRW